MPLYMLAVPRGILSCSETKKSGGAEPHMSISCVFPPIWDAIALPVKGEKEAEKEEGERSSLDSLFTCCI